MAAHYSFLKKDRKTRNGCIYDLFVFKSIYNHTYLVEVEHLKYNIKIVKFYLKHHQYSKKKYSLILKKSEKSKKYPNGSKNFIMLLNTLLEISMVYYREDNDVSFGFVGAPKISELKTNKNPDGTFINTERFRIYKNFSASYYSPEKFEHIEFKTSSGYLLRNLNNKDLTVEKAAKLLHSYSPV